MTPSTSAAHTPRLTFTVRRYFYNDGLSGGYYVLEHRHDGATYPSTGTDSRVVDGPYTSQHAAHQRAAHLANEVK